MIKQCTVEEISASPGFAEMVSEYAEMADKEMPPPFYCKENYLLLEAAGKLAVFAAVDDGVVVGFVTVIEGPLPKFDMVVAITESLFVMKKYRKKGYGVRLIEEVERYARARGLKYSFINIPHGSLKTIGVVLERKNYSVKIHTYGKLL